MANNSLIEAVEKLDLEKVRSSIAQGVDVNAHAEEGENKGAIPLLIAVLSNSWKSKDIIIELIKAGANKNAIDNPDPGFTSLHHAANLGIISGTWALLVAGADPNIKDVVGRTPLHYAGMKGQTTIFELLVFSGGDPTLTAKVDGQTPETYAAMQYGLEVGEEFHVPTLDFSSKGELFQLFQAIMKGDEATFDSLLAKNAAEKAPETGWTPLMVAATSGRKDLIEKLLAAGGDLKAIDRHGETATHYAAMYGNEGALDSLASKGADVNAADSMGNTPLVVAITLNEDSAVIKKLISLGANVNSQNEYGETPLYAAAQGRSLEIIQILLDAGADSKAKTKEGGTVLHSAARTPNPEIIRELVKRGAELSAAMDDGWQPIHVACEAGNLGALEIMIELGADLKAQTKNGQTTLDIAEGGNFDQLVEFIKTKEGGQK